MYPPAALAYSQVDVWKNHYRSRSLLWTAHQQARDSRKGHQFQEGGWYVPRSMAHDASDGTATDLGNSPEDVLAAQLRRGLRHINLQYGVPLTVESCELNHLILQDLH